jgi:hypothetical protein
MAIFGRGMPLRGSALGVRDKNMCPVEGAGGMTVKAVPRPDSSITVTVRQRRSAAVRANREMGPARTVGADLFTRSSEDLVACFQLERATRHLFTSRLGCQMALSVLGLQIYDWLERGACEE